MRPEPSAHNSRAKRRSRGRESSSHRVIASVILGVAFAAIATVGVAAAVVPASARLSTAAADDHRLANAHQNAESQTDTTSDAVTDATIPVPAPSTTAAPATGHSTSLWRRNGQASAAGTAASTDQTSSTTATPTPAPGMQLPTLSLPSSASDNDADTDTVPDVVPPVSDAPSPVAPIDQPAPVATQQANPGADPTPLTDTGSNG